MSHAVYVRVCIYACACVCVCVCVRHSCTDEEDKSSPKARTPERQLLSQRAEAVVRLKKSRGFVGGGQSVEDKARGAIDSLVKELVGHSIHTHTRIHIHAYTYTHTHTHAVTLQR